MSKIEDEVTEYLGYCEKVRQMSQNTLVAKRLILARFARESEAKSIAELTNYRFNQWVKCEMARGVSARSMNIYNSVVVAMVRYFRGVGMKVPLNLSLVVRLKEEKVQRKFYTAAEVERVVDLADEVTGLMIRIMFETGMRIAELTRLKVSDFDGRKISFVGKGRKRRDVYLSKKTLGLVRRYLRRYGVENNLWCVCGGGVSGNGEPVTVNTARVWMRRAFQAAGFWDFYPHALRHSFATDLQLKGASVAEIKEMIGHSSIATTERYLHGFDGRLLELWEKYKQ